MDPALDPAGGPSGGGTGWKGDHGFLDKPQDTTGLTAVGARMYDPLLGSFISVDPIMDLADPQQWNAYGYANNNPVTFSDPTGLLPGPLIDGAYTAPAAGKPGLGGWQVGPNRTGYTGSWNNGGSYNGPNSIGDPPVYNNDGGYLPGVQERKARAAAAHRKWQQRKANEGAAAKARRTSQHARERQNQWRTKGGQRGTQSTSARDPERDACAGKCLNHGELGTGAWDWAAFGLTIGVIGAVVGVVAFAGALLGVTAIAGVSLAALSVTGLVLGGIATAIDCVDGGLDGSCGVGIAGTALGFGGFGVAGLSTRLGGTTAGGTQTVADDVANAGITADMVSIGTGAISTGAGEVARWMGVDW